MKKLFCLMLSLALLLCACGTDSGQESNPTTEPPETTQPRQTEPTVESTEPPVTQPDPLADLRNHLPTMDGSTSLIPLEAGIRAALFDMTLEEATLEVNHSTTWGSFWSLVNDDVDLIFSCPLSQEQWDHAREMGVELETVPIAMEGFVFVVNAENPVDVLTQEQVRGIYSGEITNWSQVGGLDEEIIPYQRNTDSGSQNYMIEFMGDTPLMDAPTEMRPASMSGLMDVIAINDNARGAIGYSVYAYAADMYGNGNEIKFIQVDGVAPSKATMASGDYPLLGENFAVFNANELENSYVRQLVDWIISYDGQLALAEAGYVTVENIGFDYEEMTLSKYQGTGTGPESQGTQAYCYTLYTVTHDDWGSYVDELVRAENHTLPDGKRTFRISGLTNGQVLQEVHDFIDQQIQQWAWEEAVATLPVAQERCRVPGDEGFDRDVLTDFYIQKDSEGLPLGVKFTCDNGYFSVAVMVVYNNYWGSGLYYVRTETATWDLLTGQRMTVEDLFCQGVDIDQVMNDYLLKNTQTVLNEFTWQDTPYNSKQDFAGLPTTGWHMTHDTIYFDQNNPYFAFGAEIFLDKMAEETLTAQIARDFSGEIEGNDLVCSRHIHNPYTELRYAYSKDGILSYPLLTEQSTPHWENINREFVEYVDTYFTEEAIVGYYAEQGIGKSDIDMYWLDFHLTNFGGRYALFTTTVPFTFGENPVYYPYDGCVIFDLETGQRLDWQDLLRPGWENRYTVDDSGVWEELPLDDLHLSSIWDAYAGDAVVIYLTNGRESISISLSLDDLAL